MKRKLYFRISILAFLILHCFYTTGQEIDFKSTDYNLKSNPSTVYDVNASKYSRDENISLYQHFDKKGHLDKDIYIYHGFSLNTDTLIYDNNVLTKIVTTIKNYDLKTEIIYKYKDDEVEITSYNNSPQNGSDGKKMIKSGIDINYYTDSLLTKSQSFSFEADYKDKIPTLEVLYKYDKKNNLVENNINQKGKNTGKVLFKYRNKDHLIEKTTTEYGRVEREVFKYNDKGFVTEIQYFIDDELDDIVYYKNYEFDDKENWLKRSFESKNNPSKNYTISRKIAYYDEK